MTQRIQRSQIGSTQSLKKLSVFTWYTKHHVAFDPMFTMHDVLTPCTNCQGKHSSDEEDLNDAPDDDQYDTEDSFIDDAELVSYIQTFVSFVYMSLVCCFWIIFWSQLYAY